jgi:serpin B
VLVLANAIYFNAPWLYPFNKDLTGDAPFLLPDGSYINVPMMHLLESVGYAEGPGYQAIELPYSGGKVVMDILLPAEGEFEAFESSLDQMQLEAILAQLNQTQVSLAMPRFTYESSFALADILKQMGMPSAFEAADFSGMDGMRDLFISQVLHKAFVAVDEEGTEAAAATAVIMMKSALPEPGVEMTVDRPFLFIIRDTGTGAILFIGRVENPGP